jgi:signal-transduction protein with cAMP-binding, CBS, and nucleotidyltransferase domain
VPVDSKKLTDSIPFFRDIEPELIDRLIPYMHQKSFRKGELIFLEGDAGNEIYFIISGSISIYTFDKSKKVILAFLSVGDYFGEVSSVRRPRSARQLLAYTACGETTSSFSSRTTVTLPFTFSTTRWIACARRINTSTT